MRKILLGLALLILMVSNSWATVGWNKTIPATGENPQAISPDVIENNTAVDLMLQNYRDGYLTITLTSTSAITIGAGGVMLSNSGGSVRLMVANTSTTTMGSTNIDTGSISPSSTYYIYAYASSTTATTFSVIYSASSTSPTGITYYQQIGKFTTDGSSNFISSSSNINTQVGFGARTTPSFSSPVQATTDGFLTVQEPVQGNSVNYAYVYSDSSSSPSTQVCLQRSNSGTTQVQVTCTVPIIKNNYWSITYGGSAPTVQWVPWGT